MFAKITYVMYIPGKFEQTLCAADSTSITMDKDVCLFYIVTTTQ